METEIRNANLLSTQSSPAMASALLAVACFSFTLLLCGTTGTSTDGVQIAMSSAIVAAMGLQVWWLGRRRLLSTHVGFHMMLFGILYWYVAPAFVIAISESKVGDRYNVAISPDGILRGCLYVSLYFATSVITYWWLFKRVLTRYRKAEVPYRLDKFYLLIFGLFVAGFLPYIIFGGGLENIIHALLAARSAQKPWKAAGALGDQRSALFYVSLSGMVAAGGFAGTWAILQPQTKLRIPLLVIFGLTCLLALLDGGTRSWVALTCVPVLLAWISTSMRQHFTLGKIAAFAILICVLQLSFEIVRDARTTGWRWSEVTSVDLSERKFDNDFFTDVALSADLVPRRHEYFALGDVWAFLSHPIPRFLWQDKPISPILVYYNDTVHASFLRGKKGNKLPSHIGQFYMSFGLAGVVLVGMLSGVIGAFSSAMITSKMTGLCHLGCLLSIWWFLMARGVYPAWSYVVLFAWLILKFGFRRVADPELAPEADPAAANQSLVTA